MTESSSGKLPLDSLTLIIPCLGDSAALRHSLRSVRVDDPNLQVIVVNDGGEPFILADDLATKVLRLDVNQGPSAARNIGWRAARTLWISFLDCGDLWLKGRSDQLAAAIQSGGLWQTWSAPRDVGDRKNAKGLKGNWIYHHQIPKLYDAPLLQTGCRFQPGSTMLIARGLLDNVGGYDERLRRLEDYELFLRLSAEVDLRHRDDGKIAVTAATGGKLDTVEQAVVNIHRTHKSSTIVRAYLEEELAAVNLRRGSKLKGFGHYLKSQLTAPRPRLHYQPAEARRPSDEQLRSILDALALHDE